jgi:hypothetical protein
MIDIQLLRKNPQEIARRLAARGPGAFDAEQFERFEATRKQLQSAVHSMALPPHSRIAFIMLAAMRWARPWAVVSVSIAGR